MAETDEDMALDSKPSRRMVARAEKADVSSKENGLFFGIWSLPGLMEDYVRNGGYRHVVDDGVPSKIFVDGPRKVFETENEALEKAREVAIGAFNARSELKATGSKREISVRPTPSEFSEMLAAAHISPTDFSQIWGTDLPRVISWLEGSPDIPFPIRALLNALRHPLVLEETLVLTEKYTNYRPQWLAHEARKARFNAILDAIKRDGVPDDAAIQLHGILTADMNLAKRIAAIEKLAMELRVSVPAATTLIN